MNNAISRNFFTLCALVVASLGMVFACTYSGHIVTPDGVSHPITQSALIQMDQSRQQDFDARVAALATQKSDLDARAAALTTSTAPAADIQIAAAKLATEQAAVKLALSTLKNDVSSWDANFQSALVEIADKRTADQNAVSALQAAAPAAGPKAGAIIEALAVGLSLLMGGGAITDSLRKGSHIKDLLDKIEALMSDPSPAVIPPPKPPSA